MTGQEPTSFEEFRKSSYYGVHADMQFKRANGETMVAHETPVVGEFPVGVIKEWSRPGTLRGLASTLTAIPAARQDPRRYCGESPSGVRRRRRSYDRGWLRWSWRTRRGGQIHLGAWVSNTPAGFAG